MVHEMPYTNTYVIKDKDYGDIYAVINADIPYDVIENAIEDVQENNPNYSEDDVIDAIYDVLGTSGVLLEAVDIAGVFEI